MMTDSTLDHLFFCSRILVLLSPDQVMHVDISFGKFYLFHGLTLVHVEEGRLVEHCCELLWHGLGEVLASCAVTSEGDCHLDQVVRCHRCLGFPESLFLNGASIFILHWTFSHQVHSWISVSVRLQTSYSIKLGRGHRHSSDFCHPNLPGWCVQPERGLDTTGFRG